MAANKLHLKNVDKSYKLVPTDQKTDAGRIIYKNAKTGELHSELSVTVEYPANSGKWINVPSLLNGRVYNAKGVLDMLKAGKLTPTSTHMNEEEALETAQFRSNNLSIQPASEDELVADGIERDAIGRIVEPLMANGSPNGRGNNVYMSDVSIATAANAVSDKDAINAQQAILADIELSNDFASTFPTEEENPDGLFVRAAQPAYTSGSGANADILAAAETALAADNVNKAENNFQNQDTIDPLQEYRQKEAKLLKESKNLSNSNRQRLEQIDKLAAIMDNANAEKDDSYFYENTDPMGRTSLVDKYRFGDLFKGLKKAENPEMNAYEQTPVSTADQEMFDAAKIERFGSEKGNVGIPGYGATNQGTVSPTDQAIFDAAKAERFGLESGNVGIEGYKNDGKVSAADQAMFDKASKARGFSNEGPATRQSNKPMFDFEYKPHMRPEEKMNDARSLKGLSPDYGKMPGFKQPTNDKGESTGNYWSADENSDFWKTDAGYQKAQETWGQNLPTFVKKPQRKDIDIAAIKKWFTQSN